MDEVMKNMKTAFDEAVEKGEAEPIIEVVKRAPQQGTPAHIVAKRRYRNKVARKQRKINAKRSK
jgi:hypothetical protein